MGKLTNFVIIDIRLRYFRRKKNINKKRTTWKEREKKHEDQFSIHQMKKISILKSYKKMRIKFDRKKLMEDEIVKYLKNHPTQNK